MMAGEPENALARWSRRKRARVRAGGVGTSAAVPVEPERGEPAADVPEVSGRKVDEQPPAADASIAEPGAVTAEGLPDLASLTRESDFSVFLGSDVPDETHREAMRALWKSDPLLSAHDGLTDYNEDYQTGECFTGVVSTAYRIGRGFLLEEAPESAESEDPSAAQGQDETTRQAGVAPDALPAKEARDCSDKQPRDERVQMSDQSPELLQCNKRQM